MGHASATAKPAREPVVPLHPHGEASSFEPAPASTSSKKSKGPGLFDKIKDVASGAADSVNTAGKHALLEKDIPEKGVGFDTKPSSKVVEPVIKGELSKPSAANYNAVIDQFKVGTNPRYDANGKTYCTFFAGDVAHAMGATAPPPNQLNGNGYADWLKTGGPDKGWKAVSPEEAQKMANSGKPVLAAWNNPTVGASGHVAVIRPGKYDPKQGPAMAQAGGTNFENKHAADGFKSGPLSDVKYYVYDPKPPPPSAPK
jgi:hypothetical protein